MYYLFLDDERTPEQVTWIQLPKASWIIVRNYNAFTQYIEEHGLPEFIAFDHDLSVFHYAAKHHPDEPIPYKTYSEKTGYDAAKWLVGYCQKNNLKLPEWKTHSLNPLGVENINKYLENYKNIVKITKEEYAQHFTNRALEIVRETIKNPILEIGSISQECDFCHKIKTIGYMKLTEDGLCKCIYCE